jgi:hypothetical protein
MFYKEVDFSRSIFESQAYFSGVHFSDTTLFVQTVFKSISFFRGSTFYKYIDFQITEFQARTDFSQVIFLDNYKFTNRVFAKYIDL